VACCCRCTGGPGGSATRRSSRFLLLLLLPTACVSPGGQTTPRPAAAASFTKPISFAILEDYDKGDELSEVARDFTRFRELGVTVWRGSFGWDDYEPEPGRYDFAWLQQFATLADTMGITLRPYLGYTPGWAARGGADDQAWNDPPKDVERWASFVAAVAAALAAHPSVRSYELYNEENVRVWWEGTAAEYAEVLRRGAEAVRRGDPDAQVLLGGMVWPDLEWLRSVCDGGRAAFDVLPFHAYPETWTPDSVTVENYLGEGYWESFLGQADRACGRHPIWIDETGFATTPGKSEMDQAQWWVRAFATFLASPRVEELGIYEIKDQKQSTPAIGDAPNYYLGLLRRDGSPKLAFATVKLLLRLFSGDSITVADNEMRVRATSGSPGELYHHLFIRPDGRQLVFLWDRLGSPTVTLEFRRPGRRAVAYEPDGAGRPVNLVQRTRIRGLPLVPGMVRILEITP
jgi:hypothetical protein